MSGQEIKNLLSGKKIDSEDENHFPFVKTASDNKPKSTKTTITKAKKTSIETKKVKKVKVAKLEE